MTKNVCPRCKSRARIKDHSYCRECIAEIGREGVRIPAVLVQDVWNYLKKHSNEREALDLLLRFPATKKIDR